MTDKEIEIELGEQVHAGKPLTCPLCSRHALMCGDDGEQQPMSSYGDYRYDLFCPHCDLGVPLEVFYNPGKPLLGYLSDK